MVWFKVDDGFAFHRKTVAAGNKAIGLWARAGSWSAQHLTDGFIPDHMIRSLDGTVTDARRLVEVALWCRVDGGYQAGVVRWAEDECGYALEVVERPPGAKGFAVLPRRWVVERSFAWAGRYRRLSKDDEARTQSAAELARVQRDLAGRIDDLESQVDGLPTSDDLSKLDGRIQDVERKVDSTGSDIDKLNGRLDDLEQRVDDLESSNGTQTNTTTTP